MKKLAANFRNQSTFSIAWDMKVFNVVAAIIVIAIALDSALIVAAGFDAPLNSVMLLVLILFFLVTSHIRSVLSREFSRRSDSHEYV